MAEDAWLSRHQAVSRAVEAVNGKDDEDWATAFSALLALPRPSVDRERDQDRDKASERFRDRQAEPEEDSFPLPFADLNDKLYGGFRRGHLIVLAADGKSGKSMILDQFLESAFRLKQAKGRLYLNEMSAVEREARWIQRRLGIAVERVIRRQLKDTEVEAIAQSIDEQFPWDATNIKGEGFEEVAARIVSNADDIAGVDILTKFPYSSERDLANGLVQLHAAAESVGTCLIVTTHLNQKGMNAETGIRRAPTPTDIRNSGSVADFADVVMFLHRQQQVDEKSGKATGRYLNDARLYMPYVRLGEEHSIKVTFNAERLRYELPAHAQTQETL